MCRAQYGRFLPFLNFVLARYVTQVLSDFEMVPVVPIVIGITFDFTYRIPWISIIRSLYSYIKIFSASFLITFLSPGIATSIDMQVPCLLTLIMMSGLLLEIVLSVRTCWFLIIIIIIIIIIIAVFLYVYGELANHSSSRYTFRTQPSHRRHICHCSLTVPSYTYVRSQRFNCYRRQIERPKNWARPPYCYFRSSKM